MEKKSSLDVRIRMNCCMCQIPTWVCIFPCILLWYWINYIKGAVWTIDNCWVSFIVCFGLVADPLDQLDQPKAPLLLNCDIVLKVVRQTSRKCRDNLKKAQLNKPAEGNRRSYLNNWIGSDSQNNLHQCAQNNMTNHDWNNCVTNIA